MPQGGEEQCQEVRGYWSDCQFGPQSRTRANLRRMLDAHEIAARTVDEAHTAIQAVNDMSKHVNMYCTRYSPSVRQYIGGPLIVMSTAAAVDRIL